MDLLKKQKTFQFFFLFSYTYSPSFLAFFAFSAFSVFYATANTRNQYARCIIHILKTTLNCINHSECIGKQGVRIETLWKMNVHRPHGSAWMSATQIPWTRILFMVWIIFHINIIDTILYRFSWACVDITLPVCVWKWRRKCLCINYY